MPCDKSFRSIADSISEKNSYWKASKATALVVALSEEAHVVDAESREASL